MGIRGAGRVNKGEGDGGEWVGGKFDTQTFLLKWETGHFPEIVFPGGATGDSSLDSAAGLDTVLWTLLQN